MLHRRTFCTYPVNPAYSQQRIKMIWDQKYVPIDTFPLPLGGLGDQTQLNMRYRWTLFGLSGYDYAPGPIQSTNNRIPRQSRR